MTGEAEADFPLAAAGDEDQPGPGNEDVPGAGPDHSELREQFPGESDADYIRYTAGFLGMSV